MPFTRDPSITPMSPRPPFVTAMRTSTGLAVAQKMLQTSGTALTGDLPPSDALDDGWQATSVPVPHLRRPAGTIGLGDTLTAGVLLAGSLSL